MRISDWSSDVCSSGLLEAAIAAIRPDEGVRLLRNGRKDAARAVILERAADEMDAIGQQRRGERVALIAGIGLAVKVKAHGTAVVHPALAGDAISGHFCPPPASTYPTTGRGRPAVKVVPTLSITLSRPRLKYRQ